MKTIKDVVELMGVSRNTVNRWIKEGKIKRVKIDRAVRIPDEEFERLKKVN